MPGAIGQRIFGGSGRAASADRISGQSRRSSAESTARCAIALPQGRLQWRDCEIPGNPAAESQISGRLRRVGARICGREISNGPRRSLKKEWSRPIRSARAWPVREVWFRQGKITDAEKRVGRRHQVRIYRRPRLPWPGTRPARHRYVQKRQTAHEKAHNLDPEDPDISLQWVKSLSRAERTKDSTALSASNDGHGSEPQPVNAAQGAVPEPPKPKSGACHLMSKVGATDTTLVRLKRDPEHLRGYGLTVEINGHKSVLMLDTGSRRDFGEAFHRRARGDFKDRDYQDWWNRGPGREERIRWRGRLDQDWRTGISELLCGGGGKLFRSGRRRADRCRRIRTFFGRHRLSARETQTQRVAQTSRRDRRESGFEERGRRRRRSSGEQNSNAAGDTKSAAGAGPPSGPQDRYIAPRNAVLHTCLPVRSRSARSHLNRRYTSEAVLAGHGIFSKTRSRRRPPKKSPTSTNPTWSLPG